MVGNKAQELVKTVDLMKFKGNNNKTFWYCSYKKEANLISWNKQFHTLDATMQKVLSIHLH